MVSCRLRSVYTPSWIFAKIAFAITVSSWPPSDKSFVRSLCQRKQKNIKSAIETLLGNTYNCNLVPGKERFPLN